MLYAALLLGFGVMRVGRGSQMPLVAMRRSSHFARWSGWGALASRIWEGVYMYWLVGGGVPEGAGLGWCRAGGPGPHRLKTCALSVSATMNGSRLTYVLRVKVVAGEWDTVRGQTLR
eukprot:4574503-Prymnesium_polylepis.1